MIDVVEIARQRRAKLVAEVARLDDFLRTAEELLKYWQERGGDEGRDEGGDGDGTGPIVPIAGPDPAVAPAAKPAAEGGPTAQARKQGTANGSAGASATATPQAAEPSAAAQAEPASGADDEHFQFGDAAAADGDELVLSENSAKEDARVNAHVGLKLRQRRWMMGMTKKQLADKLGIDVEEMQRYERGEVRIGTSRMWHLAAALEVPMSYFFDDADVQAAAGADEPEVEERGRALLAKTA